MARPVAITKALTASSATAICAAQTLGAAGNLTINGGLASGGVATLDTQRQVLFTTTENDSALTATIYGTDGRGSVIVDSITLPSSTTKATNLNFKTVTRIAVNGAIGANITVGTNGVGATHWIQFDPYLTPSYLSLVCQLVTGSGNAGIQYTSDPFIADSVQSAIGQGYATPNPLAIDHPSLQSITATSEGAIDFPITAWRAIINSGTGTWKFTGIQSGLSQ